MKIKGVKIMLLGIMIILTAIFINGLSVGGIFTGFIQLPVMLIGLAVGTYGFFIRGD